MEPDSVVSHEEAGHILPGFFNFLVTLAGNILLPISATELGCLGLNESSLAAVAWGATRRITNASIARSLHMLWLIDQPITWKENRFSTAPVASMNA